LLTVLSGKAFNVGLNLCNKLIKALGHDEMLLVVSGDADDRAGGSVPPPLAHAGASAALATL
ncbi:hypothetical protein ACWAUP_004746, partial [Pseudomonas aeruginosa]